MVYRKTVVKFPDLPNFENVFEKTDFRIDVTESRLYSVNFIRNGILFYLNLIDFLM